MLLDASFHGLSRESTSDLQRITVPTVRDRQTSDHSPTSSGQLAWIGRRDHSTNARINQYRRLWKIYRTFEMTINSWYLRVVKETQVVFLVEGQELGITSDGRDDDDSSLLTLELFDWPRLHIVMVTAPQHLLYLLNLLRDEMIRLIYAQHGRHSIHRLWLQWNLSLHYYGHLTPLAYFRMILHCKN